MLPQQQHAKEIRAKLWNPPNAPPDKGINLRNGRSADSRLVDLTPRRIRVWREAQELTKLCERRVIIVFNKMMSQIAEGLDTPVALLKGEARNRPLVSYRQAAYCIVYRLTGYSIAQIGKLFKRDHTTILHAIKKMRLHVEAVAAELPADASAVEWAKALKRRIDAR